MVEKVSERKMYPFSFLQLFTPPPLFKLVYCVKNFFYTQLLLLLNRVNYCLKKKESEWVRDINKLEKEGRFEPLNFPPLPYALVSDWISVVVGRSQMETKKIDFEYKNHIACLWKIKSINCDNIKALSASLPHAQLHNGVFSRCLRFEEEIKLRILFRFQ